MRTSTDCFPFLCLADAVVDEDEPPSIRPPGEGVLPGEGDGLRFCPALAVGVTGTGSFALYKSDRPGAFVKPNDYQSDKRETKTPETPGRRAVARRDH